LSFNSSVSMEDREILQRQWDDEVKKRLPIFVVECDIENNRNAFNELQLSTAPAIVLLPPTFSAKSTPTQHLLSSLPSKYRFIPQSLEITEKQFSDFISNHLSHPIRSTATTTNSNPITALIEKIAGFNQIVLSYFLLIAASLLLFFLYLLYRYFSQSKTTSDSSSLSLISLFLPQDRFTNYLVNAQSLSSLPLNRVPLLLAALVWYAFCVSGGMFTIIKDSESGYQVSEGIQWKNLRNNFHQFISNQYMDQTVAESAILAVIYIALTIFIILINQLAFRRRRAGTAAGPLILEILVYLFNVALFLLLLAVITLLYLQLVNVYSRKSSYHWGLNWDWLNRVDWKKVIPFTKYHQFIQQLWEQVKQRLL